MLRLPSRFLLLLLSGFCLPAQAAEWQSLPEIQSTVESFVKEKLAAESGERTASVGRIDPRLKLAKCDRPEPYLPSGNRLWGNTSIGVRCRAPATWSLYVPVHIKVTNNVLVTVRPVASGQPIQAEDIQLQKRDVTAIAGSVLTAPEQAIGKNVMLPLASGSILRAESLRASNVVMQGQSVKLVAQGAGFKVTSEGQALGNATAGQPVAVKTRSGQIVKGIARSEGVVEVAF